jgi:hypothetical protein
VGSAGLPQQTARDQRRRRAAVARRLLTREHGAGSDLAAVDWDSLLAAPDWLALPEPQLVGLQCRVGALLCAPTIRLWIDGQRLAAARAVLGAPFLQALLALPAAQVLPRNVAASPRIDSAEQVGTQLRAAGAGVLLAALPSGPLRHSVEAAWAPCTASAMAGVLAQSLLARAQALVAQQESARPQPAAGNANQQAGR